MVAISPLPITQPSSGETNGTSRTVIGPAGPDVAAVDAAADAGGLVATALPDAAGLPRVAVAVGPLGLAAPQPASASTTTTTAPTESFRALLGRPGLARG